MRVFQLNTFCGVKSTGRIACEIAKLVQQDGGECRIGYGVPGISADSEPFAFQIGTKAERKVHAVIRKLFDAEGYGSWFATRKLLRELDEFRPDLIHFHNLHGCYLHLPSLFRWIEKKAVPVVWTLHDCWPFTGHCAYFDYAACERWKTTNLPIMFSLALVMCLIISSDAKSASPAQMASQIALCSCTDFSSRLGSSMDARR